MGRICKKVLPRKIFLSNRQYCFQVAIQYSPPHSQICPAPSGHDRRLIVIDFPKLAADLSLKSVGQLELTVHTCKNQTSKFG